MISHKTPQPERNRICNDTRHDNRHQSRAHKRIMVLGGHGFIGRHVVQHLNALGHDVRIGTRCAQGRAGSVSLAFHTTHSAQLREHLNGVDVVINAVGILRQRIGETYNEVHHTFVRRLADVCAQLNIRLVHVSALGLTNPVKSRFLTSKRLGEAAVKAAGGDWRIVRPSLIDGDGGYGAQWFRRVARWPVHVAPNSARGRLCPIHVTDLAEAIAAVALLDNVPGLQREFEFGGADETDVFGYLALLRGRAPTLAIRIPNALARFASHVCDLLHVTPLSFGHYECLKYDNCPQENRLYELIGRSARPLGAQRDADPVNEVYQDRNIHPSDGRDRDDRQNFGVAHAA